ncbi:MAG: hypothetical protein SNJ64_01545, partial [Endomicrobiia bacterium]
RSQRVLRKLQQQYEITPFFCGDYFEYTPFQSCGLREIDKFFIFGYPRVFPKRNKENYYIYYPLFATLSPLDFKIKKFEKIFTLSNQTLNYFLKHGLNAEYLSIENIDNFYLTKKKSKNTECVFYTICSMSKRDALSSLIKAFYHTFYPHEKASLMLHITEKENPSSIIESIISGLGFNYKWKKEINLIYDSTTEKSIAETHSKGDIFVSIDRVSDWCIYEYDAIKMGCKVIPINQFSHLDVPFGYSYDCHQSHLWREPECHNLSRIMREKYEEFFQG